MEIILFIIIGILILLSICQGIKIRKLENKVIKAFKIVCNRTNNKEDK